MKVLHAHLICFIPIHVSQSAGAVEYIDRFSEEGWETTPSTTSVLINDTKKTDVDDQIMQELSWMQNTYSLPSLPALLCSGVRAPERVLSMG